jgi:hypothetical protein
LTQQEHEPLTSVQPSPGNQTQRGDSGARLALSFGRFGLDTSRLSRRKKKKEKKEKKKKENNHTSKVIDKAVRDIPSRGTSYSIQRNLILILIFLFCFLFLFFVFCFTLIPKRDCWRNKGGVTLLRQEDVVHCMEGHRE